MSDFKRFLQQELLRRCRENPRYSLRAFARSLEIHPSSLSHILRGTRPLTDRTIVGLSKRLGLSPGEVEKFRLSAAPQAVDRTEREDAFLQLSQDVFEVVSDWYHDAILELTRVAHFRADIKWIANTLGITVHEASMAVERLVRLSLLEITASGKWVDCSEMNAVTGGTVTSAARKKLQKQALERSLQALQDEPFDLRDHSCITMAMQSGDIPEAKERIRRFRRELCTFLQRPGARPDRVYQLSVGLYPISKNSPRKKTQKRLGKNRAQEVST